MADVFISHSTKDAKIAKAVCTALEARGIHCWIAPRDVPPGAEYADAIIEGINKSRFLVLIFSALANNSRQVKAEVQSAFEDGLPIIPFRIEDTQPTGAMKHYISTFHWVNAFKQPRKTHLKELADSIRTQMAFPAGMDTKVKRVRPPKIDAAISDGTSYPGEAKPVFGLSQLLIFIPLLVVFALLMVYLNYLPRDEDESQPMVAAARTQDDDLGKVLNALIVILEDSVKTTEPKYNLDAKTDKTAYDPGESIDLTVSVDDDCYLYILNIFYGRAVLLVYPNKYVEENFLAKGKNLTTTDIAGEHGITVNHNSAGGIEFWWVIASPIELTLRDILEPATSEERIFNKFVEQNDTHGTLVKITDVIISGYDELYKSGVQANAGVPGLASNRSLTVETMYYLVNDI